MLCDLHCHTCLSDGSLGIEEVIHQAKKTGVNFLAITDHDTLAGFSRAKVLGDRYGVHIIQGVELSAWDYKRSTKVHILCYVPQELERLENLCRQSCQIRTECANEMIKKVQELYPIPKEAFEKHTKSCKSVFKQHIMGALIEYGYALEFYGKLNDELFNLKNGTCLVERAYPDVINVLEEIHRAGGVAIMAHPYMYQNIDLIIELAEQKILDGIEVYHYSANMSQQEELLNIAKKYDLIVTGGSDFHGLYNMAETHIGSYTTDRENLERIIKLHRGGK